MSGAACLADYERLAAEHLGADTSAYLFGGAADEISLRANRRAFDDMVLWPSIPEVAGPVDLETRIFGDGYRAPVLVAPIAYQRLFHADGEIATAQAAAAMGAGYILSTLASTPMRDVRAAGEGAPQWFQLYLQPDRDDTLALLRKAEAAGFSAIVVTIDAAVTHAKFVLPDDVRAVNLERSTGSIEGVGHMPSWEALAWLREQTQLPLLAKGVLRADDAARAVVLGFDAIIVSNHGGRVLDTAPAALSCLPAVVARVGHLVPVLFDSGIRRGTDVAKCLALGATAVLVGRPVAAALAVGGARAAAHALRILIDEFAVAHVLSGGNLRAGRQPDR